MRSREQEMTCKVRPNPKLVPGWATGWLVQATNGNFYGTAEEWGPAATVPSSASLWDWAHSWKPCPLPARWGSRQNSPDRSDRVQGPSALKARLLCSRWSQGRNQHYGAGGRDYWLRGRDHAFRASSNASKSTLETGETCSNETWFATVGVGFMGLVRAHADRVTLLLTASNSFA
jgi:hypothetical protein